MITNVPTDSTKRLLVRVYGDSLGMPRNSDGVPYTASYAELLRSGLETLYPGTTVDLYNRSRGGAIIGDLREICRNDSVYFGTGGVLVIQCGVVDCAPRPLSFRMRQFVSWLPTPLRKRIIHFLHRNRARLLRSGFCWRFTAPDMFMKTFEQWLRDVAREFDRIYVINIAPAPNHTELHSPGLQASIALYNQLITKSLAAAGGRHIYLVDVYTAINSAPGGIDAYINQYDGHHITKKGHELYSRIILELEQSNPAP